MNVCVNASTRCVEPTVCIYASVSSLISFLKGSAD